MKNIVFTSLFALFITLVAPVHANNPALNKLREPTTLKPEAQRRDYPVYDWAVRHQTILDRHKQFKPEYVYIGDSIVHHWGGEPVDGFSQDGKLSWNRLFGQHKVTNMGFGFDYVDNVYYRIQQGELAGCSPRVIILMIGTNNIGHRKDSARTCANNTKALIKLLRHTNPNSKILLLGILPRREEQLAPVITETNKLLEHLQDKKHIFFANPGLDLQGETPGIIRPACTIDGVHLSPTGYAILGDAVASQLSRIDPDFKGGKTARPSTIDGVPPEQVQLACIGDSITDNYRKAKPPYEDFQPIWKEFYEPYKAINLGVSGDSTDLVLGRIGNQGILDHISPKVVQIMIGTNDTSYGATVEETVHGIQRVVQKVQEKQPQAHILLLGILPNHIHNWHTKAAAYPDKKMAMDMEINDTLARLYKRDRRVTFLDLRQVFLKPDGSLNEALFYDPQIVIINGKKAGPLHPSSEGQRRMAEAIHPILERLMKK